MSEPEAGEPMLAAASPLGPSKTRPIGGVRALGVVHLTPSSAEAWTRCRRQHLLGNLLDLPASDAKGSPSTLGLAVHEALCTLHRRGTCQDRALVAEVLAGDEDRQRVAVMIERHARRCPSGADALGHELELARHARGPGGRFVVTARIDAVWMHDGVLDARDYKTGRPLASDAVGDDLRARVQAYVLAPVAAARGLRLRIRYEELGDDATEDADPFEPDDEQLAAIRDELTAIQEAMRAEREFRGTGETWACSACDYRSICRDSAAPGDPAWP